LSAALAFSFTAILLIFIAFSLFPGTKAGDREATAPRIAPSPIRALHLPFIENRGQVADPVRFYTGPAAARAVMVTRDGRLLYRVEEPRPTTPNTPLPSRRALTIEERFVNARALRVKGLEPSGTRVAYFKGRSPSGWLTDIPAYRTITLGQIYPGVELRLEAHPWGVEKRFYVAPGASPGQIRIELLGAKALQVNKRGELEVATDLGTLRFARPLAYQEVDGNRRPVAVAYAVEGNTYRFVLGPYNASRTLVIDPVLNFTYLGGSAYEYATGVAVGPTGDIYVAGWTESTDFPVTSGAYDTRSDWVDTFIAKLDPSLTTLESLTFLGGSSGDWARCLAVAPTGDVYVCGTTDSGDFPATAGAYDRDFNGSFHDGFIAKLDSDLRNLLAATYLGGSGRDEIFSLAIDAGPPQKIYVVGRTESPDFPTAAGAYAASLRGKYDAFVSALDENLQSLLASTYLGGEEIDAGRAVALSPEGEVYIAGYTASPDYPATPGAFRTAASGDYEAFVSKLDGGLEALLASTYLGGSARDYAYALALNGPDEVYVAGITRSPDFPTTSGAFDTTYNSGYDAYIARLDGALENLLASTFVGGGGEDYAYDLALDPGGGVYLTGVTWSADFPTTAEAYDPSFNGGQLYGGYADAFISKFDARLDNLSAGTYVGGSGYDEARAVAVSPTGDVYAAGYTWSSDLSTAAGVYTSPAGNYDAFVVRLDGRLSAELPRPALSVSPMYHDFGDVAIGSSAAQTFTLTNLGASVLTPTLGLTGSSGGDFRLEDDGCSGRPLAPSQTCTVRVAFSPSYAGRASVHLSIGAADAGAGALEVLLTGNGFVRRYTLVIERVTGMGRVFSEDGGISCGTDCTEVYNAGTQVTLKAQPMWGAAFLGWDGGGCSGTDDCSVTIDSDTRVTAIFDLPPPVLGGEGDVLWYVGPPETAVNVIPLREGWNLVNLPHKPLGTEVASQVASILDNLKAIWTWDETQAAWLFFSPELPPENVTEYCDAGVLPLERLEGGRAYWFHMAAEDTLYLEADPRAGATPAGGVGRHLTGLDSTAFEGAGRVSPTQALSAFSAAGTIWKWDAELQKWRVFSDELSLSELRERYGSELLPLESIGPKDGFWIEIREQDVRAFPAPDPRPRGMFYDGQYIYVQGLQTGRTYRLDPDTGEVLASFNQDLGGTDATWDGQYVWGMGWSILQKLKVGPEGLVPVARYELRPYLHHMAGVAWDGAFLWLGGFFQLDPGHISQQEILRETDSGLPYITQMEWVNGLLYALDGSRFLYVLDPDDPRGPFQIRKTYALPARKPSGLAWDGANLWISDEEAGRIYKIPGALLGGRSYDPMDDYLKPGEAATVLNYFYVDADTTLTKAGSPYVFNGGLTVAPGATLFIEPGVRLLFPEYSGVFVSGRVVAEGTPEEPIVFSHVDPDTRWSGIMVDAGSDPSGPGSVFRYCIIQHSERGIEARNTSIEVEHCWIRGMPTGLNAPPSGVQVEAADGADVRVVGNVAPNIAIYFGGAGNPAHVIVEDNRGVFIFLRGGYTTDPASVRRNLLDGGIIVEGAANLEIEGNQLGRPLECTPASGAPVTFNGNLIETDYQINSLCNNGSSFTARYNTVTNGFSINWSDPAADLLSLLDIHQNNILGGANYWHPLEVGIAPAQEVDLSQNWWGTADPAEVRRLIIDGEDDPGRGIAVSAPILTSPAPYGFIRGGVFDVQSGRPLPEATVDIGGTIKTVSADGSFAATLSEGVYTVTVTAPGFQTVTLPGVVVRGAMVTHIEIGLRPADAVPASPRPVQSQPVAAYPPRPPGFPSGYGTPGVPACRIPGTVSGRVSTQLPMLDYSRGSVSVNCPSFFTLVDLNPDGAFSITGVPSETCTVTASMPGYLASQTTVEVSGDIILPPTQLKAGDADGDGFVGGNDLRAIADLFGQAVSGCQDPLGRPVDLNCDGSVDIQDLSAAASNFGLSSPLPW